MPNIDQTPRDENGKAHGEWLSYYNNDQLMYQSNYFHGVLHGAEKGYHHDGKLEYLGNWNMGRELGYFYYFNQQKEYYLCLI